MSLTHLTDRALLLVEGEEAEHFLEGLVTSELPVDGIAQGSALLTPQGKLLFSFLISRHGAGFALECDASDVEALAKRLTLYKLRAKVTITPSELVVFAGQGGALTDARHVAMPKRSYATADDTDGHGIEYATQRAKLGVLEGPTEIIPNQDFPHDVALDLTGAVSFSKGCFVGQEVVSRVKHRGTARRRPVLISGEGIQAEQPIMVGEREVGTVRMAQDGLGIAVVRLDHLKGPATVDGHAVSLAAPPYATYSLEPETSADPI
ncbi:MAG: folate-binding protein YgfZ [Devosiaceae bacterium]